MILNRRSAVKIARMSGNEIAFRVRRYLRAAADRSGRPKPAGMDRILPENPGSPAAYKKFWDRKETFYFAPKQYNAMAEIFRTGFREEIEGILARASRVMDGTITIFERPFPLPQGDRWRADPVTGCCWPDGHWSRIPLDGNPEFPDPKYVWEINRHQFLVHTAMAFWFTREERFAESTLTIIQDWIGANPAGRGINWAESLEVATRLVSWIWALELLRGSAALHPERLFTVVAAMWEHAAHIARFPSHFVSPNTHLTGEAWGLFLFSATYPETALAEAWRGAAEKIFSSQIVDQVGADGVHRELSTGYHCYTLDYYFQTAILGLRQSREFFEAFTGRLEKMCDFIRMIQRPDGSLPMLGDADGGSALHLDPAGRNRGIPFLANATLLLGTSRYRHLVRSLPWETIWLWGPEAVEKFGAIPICPPGKTAMHFPESNYMAARTGWASDDDSLIFDAGKMGFLSAGHSHADYFHFDLTLSGQPVIVDIGTVSYHDRPWRNYCRDTAAHNSVAIDNRCQAEPGGNFSWKSLPEKGRGVLVNGPGFVLMQGRHDAYPGIRHTRTLIWCGRHFLFCMDSFTASGSHSYRHHYHFHPEIDVALAGDHLCCRGAEKTLLRMYPLFPATAGMSLIRGGTAAGGGHFFPVYGKAVPTWKFTMEERFSGSFSRGMLLIPGDGPFERPIRRGDAMSFRSFSPGESRYRLILSSLEETLCWGEFRLACDGLIERTAPDGGKSAIAIGARAVSCGGKILAQTPVPLVCCQVYRDKSRQGIWLNPEDHGVPEN